jgi:hypothetical protein
MRSIRSTCALVDAVDNINIGALLRTHLSKANRCTNQFLSDRLVIVVIRLSHLTYKHSKARSHQKQKRIKWSEVKHLRRIA